MKKLTLLFFLSSALCFQSCKKEDMINKNLEGTWTVSEYSVKAGFVNDFPTEKRTFQFFKYKKAYTRTMKGVYRVDYVDPAKLPVVDTFEYQLKNTMLEITRVQNKKVNGAFPNTIYFLRRRFLLSNSKTSTFTLTRVDTTDYYIRANK